MVSSLDIMKALILWWNYFETVVMFEQEYSQWESVKLDEAAIFTYKV